MAFSDIKSYRCIIPSMRDIRDWALSWIIEKHWEKMKYKDPTQWLSLTASVFLAIGTTIWQLKLQLAFECSLQSGKGGMVWENSIEMCISPSVKPVQVWFMKQGTQSRCTGTTQRNGMGTQVHAWLIHVNVWQKPPQYCKAISLQKKWINWKKKSPALYF